MSSDTDDPFGLIDWKAIAKVFADAHPTAEEAARSLHENFPGVSLADLWAKQIIEEHDNAEGDLPESQEPDG